MACPRCATLDRCLCLDRPAAWSPTPIPDGVDAQIERRQAAVRLCARCGNEPAVQGSPLGVRCLWPDLAAEVQAREAGPAPVSSSSARRTADDIRAEIYGLPPHDGPGLKHGPGGSGNAGPCDADCRKCALEAEIAALPVESFPRSPRGPTDAGVPVRPKPCAQRHPDGERWCYLQDGHVDNAHTYPAARELPTSDHLPRKT